MIFGQIFSIRVKTLGNTNLEASRQFKIENGSLPFDARRPKTSPLKFPSNQGQKGPVFYSGTFTIVGIGQHNTIT